MKEIWVKLGSSVIDWAKQSGLLPKDCVVSLDIGSSSIKLVELISREDGLTLVHHDFKGIAHSEDSAARENAILSALKELVTRVDTKQARFIVTFNSPKTVMRIVTMPRMPKAEMEGAIRLQAAHHFPFPIDETTILEFDPIGSIKDRDTKKMQVSVVATPRQAVDPILSLLKKAGIRPISLVPVPVALQRLGEAATQEDKVRCLVDIGDQLTELAIFKGRHLIFSRKLLIGGRDFTQALTGVLVSERGRTQLSWSEADEIKREFGFPSEGELKRVGDKISATQLISLLRSPLEQLVGEMERSFDYYREETGGEKIDWLELFGGGASLKGLKEYLAESLGIEVRMGDPLGSLKIQGQVVRPEAGFSQFGVALGAALGPSEAINFLPPEVKEETRRAVRRALAQSAIAAAILILVFFYVGLKIQITNYGKRIDVARLELLSLRLELQEVEELRWAKKLLAEEPYWDDAFKEISNMVPRTLSLTELGANAGLRRIVLKGLIVGSEKEAVLSRFMHELEEGIFKDVRLVKTEEKPDRQSSEFEVECWVD